MKKKKLPKYLTKKVQTKKNWPNYFFQYVWGLNLLIILIQIAKENQLGFLKCLVFRSETQLKCFHTCMLTWVSLDLYSDRFGHNVERNHPTNSHNVLFHAKMRREESLNVGTQNLLGCFFQEQMFAGCLYYIRLLYCFDRTQNVHIVTLQGQLSLYIQHHLSIQLWVYTAFVLLPINQSLSLSGYQTKSLGNLNHLHSQWYRFLSDQVIKSFVS